ncbi:glycosyltransferase family 39 protein [Cellulomonas endophytica]|uniref:glycosyltransferase family 39 protein n=1 Tax=Cellulomonas endophytica TaxID=2494735 RepID=UPI0013E947DF|nr:glycosyltransferase family 39 protein [Cellulomonas endophytica]
MAALAGARPGPSAAVVALVATVLQLPALGGPSLWTDEAATVSAATRSLPELWRMAGTLDAVHTTYYVLMHLWTAVAGTGEWALRLPSAVAVGVAAAGTYALARRTGGQALGLLAAALLVVLPRTTWMAVEARPYALATAVVVLSFVALARALEHGAVRRWVLYGVLVGLAVLLNVYSVLLVAAQGATVLVHPGLRPRWRAWLVSAAAAGLPLVPFALAVLGQSGQVGANDTGPLGLLRNVVVNQWFLGETPTVFTRTDATATPADPFDGVWQPAAVLLALLALGLVVVALVRVARDPAARRRVAATAAWTLPWLVLPTLALVAVAVVTRSYSPRYLSASTPALAIVLAAAVLLLARRSLRVGAVVLVVALALPVAASQRTENAKSGADWRQTAAAAGRLCAPGDGVYFAPRAAPTGTTVGLTTRGVSVAYPGPFQGLVDVTALRSPVAAANLVGESRLLRDAGATLRDLGAVCVVRRFDAPSAASAADDATLRLAGLVPTDAWAGPLDEVLRYERTGGTAG